MAVGHGGLLLVKYILIPPTTKIAFSPIYANLYVKKTLEGRSLKDNMFKFRLTETDADGNKKSGGVSMTKANDANGNVNFRLKYKKPGTYYYSIREIDNGIKDIKYDNKTVKAVVKIIEDGEGKLIVKRITQSKDSTFRNKTEPDNFISKVQTGDKFALAILLGLYLDDKKVARLLQSVIGRVGLPDNYKLYAIASPFLSGLVVIKTSKIGRASCRERV